PETAASKRPNATPPGPASDNKCARLSQDENNKVAALFQTFKERLDVKQDRRERIVKLSRDITMESKRLIFTLHRVAGASDEERLAVLTEVSQRLDKLIASKLLPISSELTGQDPWEYRRAYSPGLQELIEAMTFLEFLSTGRLLSLSGGVRDRLPSGLLVSQFDYLLGVCDLSGELMRLALNAAAKADFDTPERVLAFLQKLLGCCETVPDRGPDWFPKDFAGKLETMRQSVEKVETVCYQQCLRCIEESNIQLPVVTH
ncbi:hypothetical protein BOX15_Mlig001638g2, partial [Macrostomum lignano]